jgi:glycosyltransferase A (GT-A) superfamily protein (DUF2064 family)/SAM-dependent methyltransferase
VSAEPESPMNVDRATTVLLLAKEPVPGRVKTRLHTSFSPDEAALLAAAAIEDSLAAMRTARVARRVAIWTGAGVFWRRRLGRAGVAVIDQRPGNLNDRLMGAFLDAAAAEGPRTRNRPRLLIGMDTPHATAGLLESDWDGADAVLGLSDDGGFWAIGLRDADPEACFRSIPMSTDRTGAAQLNRLVDLGLSVKLLAPLRDVDEPADAAAVAYEHPGLRFSRCYREILDRRTRQPADRMFDEAYAGSPLEVEHSADPPLHIDLERWAGAADDVDRLILSRCEPPVLDLGSGPGRMVRALTESGRSALGVDMSGQAVSVSMRQGALALRARIEDPLPAEGRWGTVLLMDGNVGIGGNVADLLARCRQLVAPGGLIICEVDSVGSRHDREILLLRSRSTASTPLAWSRIGAAALVELAAGLDLWTAEEWSAGDRVFVALRRGF